jgi:hypothetical protein
VIDFATTGQHHWATDFARLERHLRFLFDQERSSEITQVADNSYLFQVEDLATLM